MSTGNANFTDNFTDNAPLPDVRPAPSKRKKVQTPYKPRLSTLVKRAMEDSVQDAIELQKDMDRMLDWLENEMNARESLRERINALPSPLDYRMAALLEEETEVLLRIGKLELILARMAITVTRLERRLQASLAQARMGVEPAQRNQ